MDGGASLFIALAAASSTVAAVSSVQAGNAQKAEFQRQAEQEKLAARDREIERKGRLLKALSSRNVAAATSGGTLEGSPAALIKSDMRQYNLESLSSSAGSASTVSGLKAAGTNAQRLGYINATSSLLDAGSSLAKLKK
jgi:hypothetical protein